MKSASSSAKWLPSSDRRESPPMVPFRFMRDSPWRVRYTGHPREKVALVVMMHHVTGGKNVCMLQLRVGLKRADTVALAYAG